MPSFASMMKVVCFGSSIGSPCSLNTSMLAVTKCIACAPGNTKRLATPAGVPSGNNSSTDESGSRDSPVLTGMLCSSVTRRRWVLCLCRSSSLARLLVSFSVSTSAWRPFKLCSTRCIDVFKVCDKRATFSDKLANSCSVSPGSCLTGDVELDITATKNYKHRLRF